MRIIVMLRVAQTQKLSEMELKNIKFAIETPGNPIHPLTIIYGVLELIRYRK